MIDSEGSTTNMGALVGRYRREDRMEGALPLTAEDARLHPFVVFVVPMQMTPVTNGGAARVWAMIDFLRKHRFKVGLVTHFHSPAETKDLAARVDGLWVTPSHTAASKAVTPGRLRRWWNDVRVHFFRREVETIERYVDTSHLIARRRDRALEDLGLEVSRSVRPVAVIGVFAWMACLMTRLPQDVMKVIDTIDVQHLRDKMAVDAGYPPIGIDCSAAEEQRELAKADVLLAIQRHEYQYLQEFLPDKRVVLVEHATPIRPLPSPEDSKKVLFVGNLYPPNVEGILAFIYAVWPTVRKAHPDAELHVCGLVSREVKTCLDKGIKSLGVVPDISLHVLDAALIINPTPFGTGLKIKAVEAMANAKCFISTEEGVRGLHPDVYSAAVIVPLVNMAHPIVELLSSPAQRRRLERKARQFARKHLRAESVYRDLLELLTAARSERRQ